VLYLKRKITKNPAYISNEREVFSVKYAADYSDPTFISSFNVVSVNVRQISSLMGL
jgi:hypothetical protein